MLARIVNHRYLSTLLRPLLFALSLLTVSALSFSQDFNEDLVAAAIERTQHSVRYDGAYIAIDYPNGDVPKNIGVCTDVIIRSYRSVGVDLQALVHEDMKKYFDEYPSKRIWGLRKPDSNIDHRRVPNLQVFFSRYGKKLAHSNRHQDYAPGDLVTWMLPGNLPHIGIITDRVAPNSNRPLVAHNIGAGPKLDDMLFSFPITGHYRYDPTIETSTANPQH